MDSPCLPVRAFASDRLPARRVGCHRRVRLQPQHQRDLLVAIFGIRAVRWSPIIGGPESEVARETKAAPVVGTHPAIQLHIAVPGTRAAAASINRHDTPLPRASGTTYKPKTSAPVGSSPNGPTLTIPNGTPPRSATSRCDRVIRSRQNCSSRSDSSAKDAVKNATRQATQTNVAVHDHSDPPTPAPRAPPWPSVHPEATCGNTWLGGSGRVHLGRSRWQSLRSRRSPVTVTPGCCADEYRSVHLQLSQRNQPGDLRLPAVDPDGYRML